MPEYVVDCVHLQYGDGLTLVLPVSINGHVHERIVRCRDCAHCDKREWPSADERYECKYRPYSRHCTDPDGFCHKAKPRGG